MCQPDMREEAGLYTSPGSALYRTKSSYIAPGHSLIARERQKPGPLDWGRFQRGGWAFCGGRPSLLRL